MCRCWRCSASAFSTGRGSLPPRFTGVDNYIRLFTTDPYFKDSIWVTVIFSVLAVVGSMVYSLVVALLLNRSIPARGFFRAVFYLPYVLPAAAVYIGWSWLYETNFGLFNYILSLFGIVVTDMWYGTASTYMNLPQMLLAGGNLIDGMMDAEHLAACAPGNDHSDVAWALRESMHRILYTVVHSNAMNGISVNTSIEHVTPWWQTALLAAQILSGLGLAASLVWCALSAKKKRSV